MNSIITLSSLIRFGVPKVEITGNQKAVMQYVDYEEDIVQHYGIVLEGWTFKTRVSSAPPFLLCKNYWMPLMMDPNSSDLHESSVKHVKRSIA